MTRLTERGRLPLEEIEAFVAVAEAGSYTAAAERLSISHSSLSRKVQHLEKIVGERLFDRRSHGVQLTIAGTAQFEKFGDALGIIQSAMREQARADQDVVRISMLQSFATAWLFPHYRQMQEQIGDLKVRYIIDRRPTDFRDGIDLAVRFGEGLWPNVRAIALWESTLQPIAGRQIAARLAGCSDPRALLDFPLIHLGSLFSWQHWFTHHGIEYEPRPIDHVFDEHALVLSAAENDVGIALGRTETRDFVDGQRLFHVSEQIVPVARQYYLVRDSQRPLRKSAQLYASALLHAANLPEPSIYRFLS